MENEIYKLSESATNNFKKFLNSDPIIDFNLYNNIPISETILDKIDNISADEIREFQKKSLELLQQITINTASIYDLVNFVSESKEKQDEIISIMIDILDIAKSKNKEDAGNKFTLVMKKISQNIEKAETLQKLINFAQLSYITVTSNIDKLMLKKI